MTGATSSSDGTSGLVPAPSSCKQNSFLRGDGDWIVPTDTTYAAGTGISISNNKINNTGVTSFNGKLEMYQ